MMPGVRFETPDISHIYTIHACLPMIFPNINVYEYY